mmetsp:Transcript_17395/g.48306  ORF Transcript_17395/g.48306 Transcript_17395/m.48306 type:complete len:238 (-) Transcript_17395:1629-2342(-)
MARPTSVLRNISPSSLVCAMADGLNPPFSSLSGVTRVERASSSSSPSSLPTSPSMRKRGRRVLHSCCHSAQASSGFMAASRAARVLEKWPFRDSQSFSAISPAAARTALTTAREASSGLCTFIKLLKSSLLKLSKSVNADLNIIIPPLPSAYGSGSMYPTSSFSVVIASSITLAWATSSCSFSWSACSAELRTSPISFTKDASSGESGASTDSPSCSWSTPSRPSTSPLRPTRGTAV